MFEYDGATSGGPGNLTRVYSGQSPTQVEAVLDYVPATDSDPEKRGLLSSAKDGNGNETTYAYNSLGQLTTVTPPSPLGATTLTYDSLGRIKTVTDGKSQTRTYTYDKLDRTTKIDFSGGSTVEYTYDDDGNPTSRPDTASGSTQTTSYEYDLLGRPKKETLPGLQTKNYTYDAASNLTSFTDAGGTVTYGYDPANRLKNLAEPGGTCSGTPSLCTTFGYDNRDNPTAQSLPNGVNITRTFDLGNQVTRITARKGTDPAMVDLEYSYTQGSQTGDLRDLVRDHRTNERTDYTYDFLDRLSDATTRTGATGARGTGTLIFNYHYDYDKAANRTSQTINTTGSPITTSYGYNAANQLCWTKTGTEPDADCSPTPTGATTYTYDANGNETARSTGRTQSYNIRNQTTAFSSEPVTYAGAGQEELVTDDSTILEHDALGIGTRINEGTTHHYARTPSGGLISQKSGSTRRYYIQDALGSTVALTNSAGGVAERYAYEPYGKLTTTQTISNRFLYAGGYTTDASDSTLYHFGARHYDPNLGRWTQQDPLDQPGDLRQADRYVYAGGDPVNLIDPTGTLYCGPAALGCIYEGVKRALTDDEGDPRTSLFKDFLTTAAGCAKGGTQYLPGPGVLKVGKYFIKFTPPGRAADCIAGSVLSFIPGL